MNDDDWSAVIEAIEMKDDDWLKIEMIMKERLWAGLIWYKQEPEIG
jgi:hypothetical protein